MIVESKRNYPTGAKAAHLFGYTTEVSDAVLQAKPDEYKPGDQIGQGVGYLEDGTMVVVEQGRGSIGQEVNITVTSVLQTPAGRMIFGRIEPKTNAPTQNPQTA